MLSLPNLLNIKKLRKSLGITQSELAKQTGISQSMIAKVERGEKNPSYNTAEKIFSTLKRLRKESEKQVSAGEIATKKIISVKPEETVNDALKRMGDELDQVPVIKNNKCVGSINSKLLIKISSEKNFKTKKIEDVMLAEPAIISETESVKNVKQILKAMDYILTSKKGKITGIITRSDLIKNY